MYKLLKNIYSNILGLFTYSPETETAERALFEEAKNLRKNLRQDENLEAVARMMVQNNLASSQDLIGRRRVFTMLSSYKVNT